MIFKKSRLPIRREHLLFMFSLMVLPISVGCSEEEKESVLSEHKNSNSTISQQADIEESVVSGFEPDRNEPIASSPVKFPENHDDALHALLVRMVSEKLGRPLKVLIQRRRQLDDWMFVVGTVRELNGEPVNYQTTLLAREWEEGMLDEVLLGLVQQSEAGWALLAFSFGATDAPFIDWSDQFQIPLELFLNPK